MLEFVTLGPGQITIKIFKLINDHKMWIIGKWLIHIPPNKIEHDTKESINKRASDRGLYVDCGYSSSKLACQPSS